MNIPVDWPPTVTVSTRNLVAIMLFLNDNGFELDPALGFTPKEVLHKQKYADAACRAYDPICNILDYACPGWL